MNLHALRHYHLKVACLPIPPYAQRDNKYKGLVEFGKSKKESVLTFFLTKPPKAKKTGRFQRVGNGLFRLKKTGIFYAILREAGRVRYKSLSTTDIGQARHLLANEIKNASLIDWHKARTVTIRHLVEIHLKNPMGLAESTLKSRERLLKVFERSWSHGMDIKASDVKPIMLKTWLAERRKEKSLKAAGVNNYIRMFHGLFQGAVELGAVAESPAKSVHLLKEETPERLTPSWEQAQIIINAAKRQKSKDVLTAMLLLGLGQAELANLHGEHFDFEKGQITVRRQKTQRVFTIPMYPQARPFLERMKSEGRIAPNKPLFESVKPREAIALACKRLNFPPFSPRSFRRAFIIRALEKEIDPRCVAAWQGHRDATLVLQVYGHIIQPKHNQMMAQRMD